METFPVDPPIIVSESGDIVTFESVAAAECYLEAIDVEKGRYIAYDSRGRLLQLIPTSPQISIRAAEKDAGHTRELQDLLIEYFEEAGVDDDWLLGHLFKTSLKSHWSAEKYPKVRWTR